MSAPARRCRDGALRGELAEKGRLIMSDTAQNISFMSQYVT